MKTLILILSCCLSTVVFSAERKDVDSKVNAEVRFLAWGNDDENIRLTLWKKEGEKHDVQNLDSFDMTTPITYRGSAKMIFTVGGVAPAGNVFYALDVNPEWKKILILVGKNKNHPSGLRLLALDHSVKNFPWGSYRIINTTGKALKMRLGKKLVQIPPSRESVIVQLNQKSGMIKMIATLAQSTTPFFGCVSEHRQDTRKILIFSRQVDKRLGPLALRILPEKKR